MNRKITILIAALCALMLITQPIKVLGQSRGSYTITFKSTGTNNDDGTPQTTVDGLISSGNDKVSSVTASKAYNGKQDYGVKFGRSNGKGNLVMTLSNGGQVKATKIIFKALKYGSDASKVKITLNGSNSLTYETSTLTTTMTSYIYDLESSPVDITSIKLETTTANRGYVQSVEVFYNSGPTQLTAPVLNVPTAGIKSIDLSWTMVSNASSYTLEYSTVENDFSDATVVENISSLATSYTVENLVPSNTYYFRLKAVGDGENYTTSSWSNTPSGVQPLANITLPAPTLTAETGSNQGEVDLSWNAVEHATGYTIAYSIDNENWTTENKSNVVTSYTKTGLTNGTQYYFKAKAIGDGEDYITSDYSSIVNATPAVPQLAKPAFTAITSGNGKVTPTWSNVANASSYTIEYSTSNTFTSATEVTNATSGMDITGLTNETKYYFRLKAVGDGVNYATSAWSDIENATPSNNKTITITEAEVTDFESSYEWYDWSAGDIYAYKNNGIQFNSTKTAYWIYNSNAVPGTIKSVKMTKSSGSDRTWTLKIATSVIDETGEGIPMGSAQTVGTSGATWNVTGDYDYFLLYVSGGATVIGSIEITYIPKYTVTYNANGGSGDAPAVASYYEGGSVTAAAANTFTVPSANHTFNTWNTKADGSGTSYPAGEAFSMPGANITLYAQWNRNIPVDGNNEITEDVTVAAGETVTISSITKIPNGRTLTINGTLVSATAANLVVEDGGQLIVNNAGVQATVKKSVDTWGAKTALSGWQTISTSTHDAAKDYVSFSNVNNLVYQEASVDKYNVYKFNEPNTTWYNNLNTSNSFSQLDCGRGYLYRTGGSEDIAYTGELNYNDVEVDLSYTCENANYKGFNLIGNPYSHSIYKGAAGSAIPNGTLLAEKYYALDKEDGTFKVKNDGTEIPTGTAILVQAIDQSELGNNYTLTIANSTSGATAKDFNGNIWFTVKNSEFSDVACVEFKEGRGLNKMKHYNENAPMLYINHDGESFASVNLSEDTRVFDLSFKAQSMSRYTLSAKANGNFSYFHLIDRLTGEDVDMLLEGEYSFIATPDDNANRFIVRLSETSNYDDNNEIFAFQNGNDIVVKGNGELQVFDVIGRMVMNQHINGVQTVNVNAQGVYIFRLIGNEIQTQKIVVK